MFEWFHRWQQNGVRGLGPGIAGNGWYIKLAPQIGFSLPWFRGSRLRWARHHGVQRVEWRNSRWVVTKQIAGRSKVKGERYGAVR